MDKQLQLAWAAGFFDGEGYIGTSKRSRIYNGKKYNSLYLRIGINHVAPEPLEEISKLFGGNVRLQNKEKVVGNRKPRNQWKITTEKAVLALKEMLPYMKNKNKVALLAIEFQDTMNCERTRWGKLPNEIIEKREQLRDLIIKLNAES